MRAWKKLNVSSCRSARDVSSCRSARDVSSCWSARDVFLALIIAGIISLMLTYEVCRTYLPGAYVQDPTQTHTGQSRSDREIVFMLGKEIEVKNKARRSRRSQVVEHLSGMRPSDVKRQKLIGAWADQRHDRTRLYLTLHQIEEEQLSQMRRLLSRSPLTDAALMNQGLVSQMMASKAGERVPGHNRLFMYEANEKSNTSDVSGADDVVMASQERKMMGLDELTDDRELCCVLREIDKTRRDSHSNSDISPCYMLPRDCDKLQTVIKHTPSSYHHQHIKHCQYGDNIVVHRQNTKLISLFPSAVYIQFHVFVTSILPLRIYLHHQASVRVAGRETVSTYHQLKADIYRAYGKAAVSRMRSNVHMSIMELLLASEVHIVKKQDPSNNRCSRCFSMLQLEAELDSAFELQIVKVGNYWPLNSDRLPPGVLTDWLSLLSSSSSVAADVAKALRGLDMHTRTSGEVCSSVNGLCLAFWQLLFLLNSRRESLVNGDFTRLYPSNDQTDYDMLLASLQGNAYSRVSVPGASLTSSEHSFLVGLESYYSNMAAEDTEPVYDDLNIPLNAGRTGASLDSPNDSLPEAVLTDWKCSHDQALMPYLAFLQIYPPVSLTPPFSRENNEYWVTVEYDVTLVRLSALTESCLSEPRLEEKFGPSRTANITVGLGENRIPVFVVDVTHTEPWILSTYTVYVYRRSSSEGLPPFRVEMKHNVCTVKQTCSLPYSPTEDCGLTTAPWSSWAEFQHYREALPLCSSGDAPGEWVLPCQSCTAEMSCFWAEAQWQPYQCQFPRIASRDMQKCFAGKKFLFIGDSTNRGIMHYLMEKVNSSLSEWDKTHTVRTYTRLNNGTTSMGFAYYPQFWLPSVERPVFDKALYHLVSRSYPLKNNTDTVIVVGGVHWLRTHHINVLAEALNREGLQGVEVIIKGLGAGFHQPVNGVHCIQQEEHERLFSHNRQMIQYATRHAFHVIDTFNMTMARYKDFLQGKCACHFHKVDAIVEGNESEFHKYNTNHQTVGRSPARNTYHVSGYLNAIYSEMLAHIICNKRT